MVVRELGVRAARDALRDTARGVVEVGRACKYAEFRFGVEVLAAGLREPRESVLLGIGGSGGLL